MSEICSPCFGEKQAHVEDEGGMRRLRQSGQTNLSQTI